MCGIAGIVDLTGERPIDRIALAAMTRALAHRGPDGEGFAFAPGVGLGHRRLAIIDLAGGAQPFESQSGRGILAFNGQIYNFTELKSRLSQQGVRFRTNSDTEVLAEGLQRFGPGFIEELRGMYAFAWWDRSARTLLLARDRFGEKPLYYATSPDGYLLFASEIGAIEASGILSLNQRPDALSDYFLFGYVPDPKSVYEGVHKLPSGTTLTSGAGQTQHLRRYWRPHFSPASPSFDDAANELARRIDDAVSAQMVSDVPIGAFLSGGVDSASVVSAMAADGGAVSTCTIGFSDSAFDERAQARATAERYGTRHFEHIVELDAEALIDRIAATYGEPFADPSALPTFEMCRLMREHATVALTGDGADELFGGYRRHLLFAQEERLRRLAPGAFRKSVAGAAGAIFPKLDWAPRPFRLKTTLQALGEDSVAAYGRAVSQSLPDRLAAMLSPDFQALLQEHDPLSPIKAVTPTPGADGLTFAQEVDLATWLPGRMLTKIDRAAMAHGLETRAPFLDRRVAEWALTLPASFRMRGTVGKYILRNAMRDRIPERTLRGPKKGFSPPLAKWLRAKDGPADRIRQSSHWRNSGCFRKGVVERMVDSHQAGRSDFSNELWMLIMFDAYLRRARCEVRKQSSAATPAIRAASA
jgi:asparagine synthase (glutamine-hydrolysing)